ncbi:hypothetical protein H1S01_19600 [Heliobacterium chlorum]|uniref:Uncharacterized protein n=1 Tax=Heliobacterium chlorum TaxID=2698 RepID=A0ABR7T7B0_HELCL|nr:hypothetical protein [Heliobacterium chlorum]MBC9786650.1 hypothetical protein [Heliobacterium chlorum]
MPPLHNLDQAAKALNWAVEQSGDESDVQMIEALLAKLTDGEDLTDIESETIKGLLSEIEVTP